MTRLILMLFFSKTARNYFIILSLHKVDNISFQMSLGSQLAALVWQTGVDRHIARSKEVIWRDLVRSWLSLMLYFSKTARNFFKILCLHKVDKISFQMSLGSQLAALIWQTDVHRNIATGKEVILRNRIRSSHYTTIYLWCYISQKRLVICS